MSPPSAGPCRPVRKDPSDRPVADATSSGLGAEPPGTTTGLLLAAGAGRRYGTPKILVPGWLDHGVNTLRAGGCDIVHVVTGAARPPLPNDVREIYCPEWDQGIGASLRRGLEVLGTEHERVVIHLVDYPDIGPDVVSRVLERADDSLARAVFDGRPGHPVVVAKKHRAQLAASLRDEDGAGPYLRRHGVLLVECGDLARGHDMDVPADRQDRQ